MAAQKSLLNFIVDASLLKRIEDFRFRHRFQTRAAAIKWLLDWALKQKPSPQAAEVPEPEVAPQVAAAPQVATREAPKEPPRESSIQALRDQGYEVGDTTPHPDGTIRILVRSKDESAWVNVVHELQDLAAGRVTLRELAARRYRQ
jgi:hypothetical protein